MDYKLLDYGHEQKEPLMKWFDVKKELPPKDGWYWVSYDAQNWTVDMLGKPARGFYDGYGFLLEKSAKDDPDLYMMVSFWSYPSALEKRYGKRNGS